MLDKTYVRICFTNSKKAVKLNRTETPYQNYPNLS
jgi:hypothetical protein